MLEEICYEIRLLDVLDEKWAIYFTPFTMKTGLDGTVLTGIVYDQAELFGVLLKIRDLGLQLISITPVI